MSLLFADNDPLAPKLGRRNPAFSPGEILQSQLEPAVGNDWFALSAAVGPEPAPNRREDVLKVQTLLGQAGHYDIKRTYGPTGWWGGTGERAVKDFQKQNGLKVDGLLNPGGPTIKRLEDQLSDVFQGFTPPSPADSDAHYKAVRRGEPEVLTFTPPQLALADAEGLDEEVRAANRRTVDYLMGYSVNNGLDEYSARDILQNGEPAIQRHRDLLHQINDRDPKRAHDFAWGILGHLPQERQQDFMGFEVPRLPPVGLRRDEWRHTLEVRPDDPVIPPKAEPYNPDKDTGKRVALLEAESGEPAASPPPETGDGEASKADEGKTVADPNAGNKEKPVSQEFLDAIWSAEQGNRKPEERTTNNKASGSSEKGKYQINDGGLVDIGWKDKNGNWTDLAKTNGVKSNDDFLKDASAQDKAAQAYFMKKEEALRKEADAHRGQEIDGLTGKFKVTDAGLVAAAHRDGQGVVKDYLDHQKKNNWKSDFSNIDPDVAKNRNITDKAGNIARSTEDRFRAIETRLRKFENVPYRK